MDDKCLGFGAGGILALCQRMHRASGEDKSQTSSPLHKALPSLTEGKADVLLEEVDKFRRMSRRNTEQGHMLKGMLGKADPEILEALAEARPGREFAAGVIDGYYSYGLETAGTVSWRSLGRALFLYELVYRSVRGRDRTYGPFFRSFRRLIDRPYETLPELERKNNIYLEKLESSGKGPLAGYIRKRLRELLPGCGGVISGGPSDVIEGYFAEYRKQRTGVKNVRKQTEQQ